MEWNAIRHDGMMLCYIPSPMSEQKESEKGSGSRTYADIGLKHGFDSQQLSWRFLGAIFEMRRSQASKYSH